MSTSQRYRNSARSALALYSAPLRTLAQRGLVLPGKLFILLSWREEN